MNHSINSFITLLVLIAVLARSSSFESSHQTKTQHEIVQDTKPDAELASHHANREMYELFANPATLKYLQDIDDSTHLSELDVQTLVKMFWDEISVAELVHNFGEGGRKVLTPNL